MSVKKIIETDLYKPIYQYLSEQGYKVCSEVKDCDVTAVKDEELIIIEMKTNFNATLLIQAVQRQKAADLVYIAIPKPKKAGFSKQWKDMCYLVKRLELGLIVINFKNNINAVEVVFHPGPYAYRKNKNMRNSIIKEINGRYKDYNEGGSTRKKIMTAYKEASIYIACCLESYGSLSPKKLRELGTSEKTQSILSKNFYGWFNRVVKGVYELTEDGLKVLEEYSELAEHYRNKVNKYKIPSECKNLL